MIKNKKLAVCLIIFAFLVIVVVLTSTIFALSSIKVSFLSTTDKLSGQEESIISSADFNMGSNVLFLGKTKYISKMEKNNPYLKIINIETIFPNSIKINCVERTEVFAIKQSDNSYIICDEDFKVLKVSSVFINSSDNAIVLTNVTGLKQVYSVGDFAEFDDIQKAILQASFNSFREWNISYVMLKAKIKSIEIDYERDNQILVNMRSGVQIVIKDANSYNSDKFNLAFSTYDSDIKYQNQGIIEVRLVKVSEGEYSLQAYYRENSD